MLNLPLTDNDRWTLYNALQAAREKYQANQSSMADFAAEVRKTGGCGEPYASLIAQFEKQIADVDGLMLRLANLEE